MIIQSNIYSPNERVGPELRQNMEELPSIWKRFRTWENADPYRISHDGMYTRAPLPQP
jgi:hypothetical protein